jgi:hypothetical protein
MILCSAGIVDRAQVNAQIEVLNTGGKGAISFERAFNSWVLQAIPEADRAAAYKTYVDCLNRQPTPSSSLSSAPESDDPNHPPYYELYDMRGYDRARVALANSSPDHFAHDVSASKRESGVSNSEFRPAGGIIQRIMPGDMVELDGTYGTIHVGFEQHNPEHRVLEIFIKSLGGRFYEQLLLERLDDGYWVRALRVLEEPSAKARVLFQKIDPAFPRNQSGSIDWPEVPPAGAWPTTSVQTGPVGGIPRIIR